MAFREVSPPQVTDDLSLNGLSQALRAQQTTLLASPEKKMSFGSLVTSRGVYAAAISRLLSVLDSSLSADQKYTYIRESFRFVEIYGGDSWGEVLLTGYFEPSIEGSTIQTTRFSQPLYGKPNDLVSIKSEEFAEQFKGEKPLKGRVEGDTLLPYFSRQEIDGPSKALSGRGLELCFVDPVDGFFLHIQGSGTVRLPDGKELFVTYADKNGRKYEAIGKYLRSKIAPAKITMQRIEHALRAMTPQERFQILFMNPSYIFFRISLERALTHMGVPATPARTIASDATYVPKGALAMLNFRKPIFSDQAEPTDEPSRIESVSRLVVDQDTGSAITGTNRIDLFVGRGDEAKRVAGVLQDRARILYLVPR
jgi:membrane-bound lytic murein transglycosylase A